MNIEIIIQLLKQNNTKALMVSNEAVREGNSRRATENLHVEFLQL